MPPTMKINKTLSPAKTYEVTHAVNVGRSGGSLQGSWDVPSAHSMDRTSAQVSVTDQFEAATAIQKIARGQTTRALDGSVIMPGQATIYDLAGQIRSVSPNGRKQPGKASPSFEARDLYGVSPYGMGYAFVNNRHDQFGSTDGFNESKTSVMADPKPTAQMRVKSGYTGHVPKGRDHIGSTYRTHDNRGSAGKTMVPIPNDNIEPPMDEVLAKAQRNLTYHAGQSAVEKIAGEDNVSTIPVPTRVQRIFCDDPNYHIKGGENFAPKAYVEGANPMTGYTGHVSSDAAILPARSLPAQNLDPLTALALAPRLTPAGIPAPSLHRCRLLVTSSVPPTTAPPRATTTTGRQWIPIPLALCARRAPTIVQSVHEPKSGCSAMEWTRRRQQRRWALLGCDG